MSLLAWYPLIANGNNQGLDGVDLTTVGSVTYTAGKLGNAASFSANLSNYFRRPQIKINDNFSFACWYKLNSTESTTWQTLFFEGRDVNSDGWGFRINGSNKRVIFCCGSSSYTYGTDLTIGTWHHVCMTIKNAVWTAYIDGSQVSSGSIITLPALTEWGTYFFVGCLSNNYYPLNGQVQDIRIYDNPLSKKEVKELAKGLCLHLPLDWGGNKNILPYTPVTSNPSEYNTELSRTVWVRSTTATGESYIWGGRSDVVEQSTKYTFSAWIWVNDYVKSVDYYWLSTNTTNKKTGTNFDNITATGGKTFTPNQWHYVTWTFTTKADDYTGFIRIDNNGTTESGTAAILKVYNMKIEKGSVATPYLPNTADTLYTTDNYGSIYYEDDSGYNHDTSPYGVNNVPCTAPRGITGTTCGSGSCIILGKSIKLQCPISFAFWFNTSDLTNNNNRLISCTEGGGWNVELSGNYLCWITGTGASSNTYKYCISTKTYTELQNAWHHIVCTYDGLKAQMYIDGVLNKETVHYTTFTPIFYNANNSVFLCAEAGGNAVPQTFTTDTSVSDFRFYATILSADDVKELYQVGAQIDKSGNFYCGTLVEV